MFIEDPYEVLRQIRADGHDFYVLNMTGTGEGFGLLRTDDPFDERIVIMNFGTEADAVAVAMKIMNLSDHEDINVVHLIYPT